MILTSLDRREWLRCGRGVAALSWVVMVSSAVSAQDPGIVSRVTPLIGAGGQRIGEVVLRGSANATVVRITVDPGGLMPGWHGVYFAAVGDCSDPDQFRRAKNIVDHLGKDHGLLKPDGPKEGDLPNFFVNADGSARAEMSSLSVRLLGPKGLLEGAGSALIIGANEDDHTSQPVGNSGSRAACAELK